MVQRQVSRSKNIGERCKSYGVVFHFCRITCSLKAICEYANVFVGLFGQINKIRQILSLLFAAFRARKLYNPTNQTFFFAINTWKTQRSPARTHFMGPHWSISRPLKICLGWSARTRCNLSLETDGHSCSKYSTVVFRIYVPLHKRKGDDFFFSLNVLCEQSPESSTISSQKSSWIVTASSGWTELSTRVTFR